MQILKTRSTQLIIVGMMVIVTLIIRQQPVSADGPDNVPQVGLSSTTATCIPVATGNLSSASTAITLNWEGDIDQAYLYVAVAGTEANHRVYVNGHPIFTTPIQPAEYDCQVETSRDSRLYSNRIPLSPDLLTQGENVITLTNDGDVADSWMLINAYIRIRGQIKPTALGSTGVDQKQSNSQSRVPTANGYQSGGTTLTSTYEAGATNDILFHAPNASSPAVPLVVAIHGMGGEPSDIDGWGLRDAVESKGWALVAPNMHGKSDLTDGADSLAYVGAQHDIIDTIKYMQDNFAIDSSRIYIVGESMGGLTTSVMVAKYPDVFAAALQWMGISDVTAWHGELPAPPDFWSLRERTEDEIGGPPSNPAFAFEYARRSATEMYPNMQRMPYRIYHDEEDLVVFVSHSQNLADRVNSLAPGTIDVVVVNEACDKHKVSPDPYPPSSSNSPYGHCYKPDPIPGRYLTPTLVMDFLEPYSRDTTPPNPLTIWTDESKSFYWLNVDQTGGDHWTHLDIAFDSNSQSITALISDTATLNLGLNLGATPIADRLGLAHGGLGLPGGTYLIKEQGQSGYIQPYISGYLTTTLSNVGSYSLTIAPVEIQVSATPYQRIENETVATSTVTVLVQDSLGNPVPDGTLVTMTTTTGTFPNNQQLATGFTSAGQLEMELTLDPHGGSAHIEAEAVELRATTTIKAIGVWLSIILNSAPAYKAEMISYTYLVTNTGDITLTDVTIVDDNGTPGNVNDDVTLDGCIATLLPGQTDTCSKNTSITQDTTSTAQLFAANENQSLSVADQDTVTLTVYDIDVSALPALIFTTNQTTTVAVQVADSQGVSPPNGTSVQFLASSGTFLGDTTLTNGGATSTLSELSTSGEVNISVTVGGDTEATTVSVFEPAIGLNVTVSDAFVSSGMSVTYTYAVSNTGNITLTNVSLVDNEGPIVICTDIELVPNQIQDCGSKTAIINDTTIQTATVSGTDAPTLSVNIGNEKTVKTVPVDLDLVANPSFIFADGVSTATITATFKDESNVPLPNDIPIVFQTDRGTFMPGSVVTISGGQGQAIVNLVADTVGDANNIVKVILGKVNGQVSLPILSPAASIALDLTPDNPSILKDDELTFIYRITNTGNERLTDVSVTDNFGLVCNVSGDLLPNEMTTCDRTRSLPESVSIEAVVAAEATIGGTVVAEATSIVTVVDPDLTLVIKPSEATIISGQSVTYNYVVTNTGDVSLADIVIIDDEGSPGTSKIVCTPTSILMPNASVSCFRQALLNESVINTATVQGQVIGKTILATDSTQVTVRQSALSLTVSPSQVIVAAGMTQEFTYALHNTGDTTISNIIISDDSGTSNEPGDDLDCVVTAPLEPDAQATCSLNYEIGTVMTRTVTATGIDEISKPIETTATVFVKLNITPSPNSDSIYIPLILR